MFLDGNRDKTVMDVSPALLWDIDLEKLDYEKMKHFIVRRVIERGLLDDFNAIFNRYGGFYGVRRIVKEIPNLSKHDMEFASISFNLPLKSMLCYTKKSAIERPSNFY